MKKGDEDKISQALAKMMSEDKTLRVVNDSANRQSLIYGIGDQHLDIVANKLKERYKVDIELSKPKVPFRETLRKTLKANIRNSPADMDSMVMSRCVSSRQAIWKHLMYLSRL